MLFQEQSDPILSDIIVTVYQPTNRTGNSIACSIGLLLYHSGSINNTWLVWVLNVLTDDQRKSGNSDEYITEDILYEKVPAFTSLGC